MAIRTILASSSRLLLKVVNLEEHAEYLLAFTWLLTSAMDRIASRLANGHFTVVPCPAIQADLLALWTASVMTKLVISRTAECCTGRIVIGDGALYPHAVCDAGVSSNVIQCLPFRWWQNDAREGSLLN